MTYAEHTRALQDLDRRHDEILAELEDLNSQIEEALAACSSASPPASVDP